MYFKILDILEDDNTDSIINPAQHFYRSCLNSGKHQVLINIDVPIYVIVSLFFNH